MALLALSPALLVVPGARAASPILWVSPRPLGLAVLGADGTVRWMADAGGEPRVLARGVQSDAMRSCGAQLLAVGADGRLLDVRGGAVGPRVSPHSRPACLADGGVVALSADARSVLLLGPDLAPRERREVDALPDGDPVEVGGAVALLATPTQRYRHGVLGDEIEAGAVTLLDAHDLHPLGNYEVAGPAVIEQRRVLAFPAAGPAGMLLTRSSAASGAGVVALALVDGALREVGATAPIGAGERWLNLFAARDGHAYAVRTPHLGGPLERYAWLDGGLRVERYDLGVTNHRLGSRNLDLGVLLPAPEGAAGERDLLALPTPDRRGVRVVACGAAGCRAVLDLALDAPLSSNLAAARRQGGLALYAGLANGTVQRFALEASLWAP